MDTPEKGPSTTDDGEAQGPAPAPAPAEQRHNDKDLVEVRLDDATPVEKPSTDIRSDVESQSQEAPPEPTTPWRRRAGALFWPGIAFLALCVIVFIIGRETPAFLARMPGTSGPDHAQLKLTDGLLVSVATVRLHAPGLQPDGTAAPSGGTASGASSGGSTVIPLRIMPLGASITSGVGSSDGQGYRPALKKLLRANNASLPFAFVGSRETKGAAAPTPEQGDNEGWPGLTIDAVSAHALSAVPLYRPNLVLVNVGTNDCIKNISVSTAHVRMRTMLETAVWAGSPRATVVLSTLLLNNNKGAEGEVELYNGNLAVMARELQAAGRPIVLVEMHGADGPQAVDLTDNVHPNDGGYAKMAAIWFRGISDARARGFLKEPEYVDWLDDGIADGSVSYWDFGFKARSLFRRLTG